MFKKTNPPTNPLATIRFEHAPLDAAMGYVIRAYEDADTGCIALFMVQSKTTALDALEFIDSVGKDLEFSSHLAARAWQDSKHRRGK